MKKFKVSDLFYTIRKLSRFTLYILFFPYIIYLGWKKESAFNGSSWHELIKSIEKIQWFGGLSPRDLFLLGYAHFKLDRFNQATKFLEIIQAPLENIDEEACRYCTHAWLLYKKDKPNQAKAILEHSVTDKWPAHRLDWVKEFLKSVESGKVLNNSVFDPGHSIH